MQIDGSDSEDGWTYGDDAQDPLSLDITTIDHSLLDMGGVCVCVTRCRRYFNPCVASRENPGNTGGRDSEGCAGQGVWCCDVHAFCTSPSKPCSRGFAQDVDLRESCQAIETEMREVEVLSLRDYVTEAQYMAELYWKVCVHV